MHSEPARSGGTARSASSRQPPIPSHTAPAPHCPFGSCPSGTEVQVPTWPARSHAMQAPVQARSQHTPSAQWPVVHCASDEQAAPGPTQVTVQAPAPLQVLAQAPALGQSAFGSVPAAANAVAQPLVGLQVTTVHFVDGGGQTMPVPPPHTPPVQTVPLTQALPLGQAVPSGTAAKPQPLDGEQV